MLESRPLRQLPADARLAVFTDEVWDLSPAMFEEHSPMTSFSFQSFPTAWKEAVKEYIWQLINDVEAPGLTGAPSDTSLSLRTISLTRSPLLRIFAWADASGIRTLEQLGSKDYDRLLTHICNLRVNHSVKAGMVVEMRRLWSRRSTLPPELMLPPVRPWQHERTQDLLNSNARKSENRTPRLPDDTLVPLLAWSMRLVRELSGDIIAAFHEYLELAARGPAEPKVGTASFSDEGTRQDRLLQAIDKLKAAGLGIPGREHSDGGAAIRWGYLGRLTGSGGNAHRLYDTKIIEDSGLPVDDDAYLFTAAKAKPNGKPWRTSAIRYDEAPRLAESLSTACFVVIAYLSGMRPGEVLSLSRGCASHDMDRDLWLVSGLQWKGVKGPSGAKNPEGETRILPWVVHPIVAEAVGVLERLHTETLLFPRLLKPVGARRGARTAPVGWRSGSAKTTSRIGTDITRLVAWVNKECAISGDALSIPPDPYGPISPSRFRRTLAWHIVRKPRGLVAAAIQYGHIAQYVTQGYAGTYAAGFRDEMAFERWLERIEEVDAVDAYLDAGGAVSGPAAAELIGRTRAARAKFAGRVLSTSRQAAQLLTDPVLQVHAGRGMHCVFDPAKALCAADNESSAPNLGGCRSNCANIARTDGDAFELQEIAHRLAAVAARDSLAPSVRHHRIVTALEPMRAALDEHERAVNSAGSD